jgi:hypothetical protein
MYVALFTSAPSDSGGGTEVSTSGTGYVRKSVPSGALTDWKSTQGDNLASNPATGTGGTTSNSAVITFANAPTGTWGTPVTHVGVFDNSSGGNLLFWCALTTSKNIQSGDAAPSFAIGSLTFRIDD